MLAQFFTEFTGPYSRLKVCGKVFIRAWSPPPLYAGVTGSAGLSFVCFVVLNSRVLSAHRFGSPPPPPDCIGFIIYVWILDYVPSFSYLLGSDDLAPGHQQQYVCRTLYGGVLHLVVTKRGLPPPSWPVLDQPLAVSAHCRSPGRTAHQIGPYFVWRHANWRQGLRRYLLRVIVGYIRKLSWQGCKANDWAS